MECFAIDESGYTGANLLDPEQRFQGASAIAISDEDAAHLIRKHFPKLGADELKYRALARRPGNHDSLLNLLRDILTQHKCVTYICDKRYLLTLMFLNYATEPFYYRRGINFYENGQHFTLGSSLYLKGPTLFGKDGFEVLLASFQRAVKEKTQEAINDLVSSVRRIKWKELPKALGPLAGAFPECLAEITLPNTTTDAAFAVLQGLISRMEVMADGTYRVAHDQSKNLLTYHALIQRFIDHDQVAEFRQSEIATLKFPLKLSSVTQVDSKDSPAVQLADVLIGATIEAANVLTKLRKPVLDAHVVLSLYSDEQFIHMIPSLDFEGQKKLYQGTQSAAAIDYIARHLQ
ncbi:DUF3800 domain-containing protein [Saezia sanguinis]|uniref:DUF3800 domain-containing protein n=1 Tax=Saezia sanguinis TaxID=1965230 RepID=UPI00306FBAFD